MTGDPPALSRFELAARELRALGIVVTRLPGEYRMNYRSGTTSPAHGKRGRRPRRMTPKAMRRRMIR
jgi:hypothetical protein